MLKKIRVSEEAIQEAKNIVDGFYAPLEGFLSEADLASVLEKMRLTGGEVWPMPIVLDVDAKNVQKISKESAIIVANGKDEFILKNISIFPLDKKSFSENLFGTTDLNHPGVARVWKMKNFLIGGKLESWQKHFKPGALHLTPEEAREIFHKNKWANVVAFQTRNPPHRSHEYLQKTALELVDGILINPVVGPKKSGDFRDEHIIGAYRELIKHYYPPNSAVLGTFHTFMRYAGPKEAVFHALVRRNLGCTHMIIGRDHAGVGNYYGTYDAQRIFDSFTEKELGIRILKYENVTFCRGCGDMAEENSCQHDPKDKVHLSGTSLREKFTKGDDIPEEFMRKEVIEYLKKNKTNLFV